MTASDGPPTQPTVIPFGISGMTDLPGVSAPRRGPVFGQRHAVATDDLDASLAGLEVLQRGGKALDAAIAISAVNTVKKPQMTHLGGDAFVLIWHRGTGAVECLNAGGRASRHATPERFADGIPAHGPAASTVPGLVDAWAELHARHGSQPLLDLLAPAIELAEAHPVSTRLSAAMSLLAGSKRAIDNESARAAFLVGAERPYAPGEILRQPELAETLRSIAQDGREGFYGGRVGRAICDTMAAGGGPAGGLIDADDLARPQALWHDPLTTTYRGCTVYEQALPSQGIILLVALNIAGQFPLAEWGLGSADAAHVMIEATRLAFADVRSRAADPLVERVPVDELLSEEHAQARASEIDLSRVKQHQPAPLHSDTTSFVVADEDTVVSFIQSIFWPWGNGVVISGTGVVMNNRMMGFHAEATSPNRIAPGKRTVHTLNTFLVVRDGALVAGGGTPGADFQVQVNLQNVVGVVDWGLDLQSAIDAPKWVGMQGNSLWIEDRFSAETRADLAHRGHTIESARSWNAMLSRTQLVASQPGGGWAAASDLRGEGVALAR